MRVSSLHRQWRGHELGMRLARWREGEPDVEWLYHSMSALAFAELAAKKYPDGPLYAWHREEARKAAIMAAFEGAMALATMPSAHEQAMALRPRMWPALDAAGRARRVAG